MKNLLIASAIALCLLSACGGGTNPSRTAAQNEAASTKSPRDQVYDIIANDPLAFNGVLPPVLEDRTAIPKGLPREKKNPRDVKIAMTLNTLASDYYITNLATLEEELAKEGYNFVYQVSDRNLELRGAQIDAFISQKVDLIIVNGDTQSHSSHFLKAAQAGIPTIATSNQTADSSQSIITDFLSGSYKAGWEVGQYTGHKLYEPGKTYKIGGVFIQLGTADTESRTDGFIAGFNAALRERDGKPYPSTWDAMLDGYKMWTAFKNRGSYVSEDGRINLAQYGQGLTPDTPGGEKGAADLVAGNRDMDILFIETDTMWPGVEVVLRQNELTAGKDLTVVCAADGTRTGMDAIREGKILAVANNSSAMIAMGIMEIIRGIFQEGKDFNNIVVNTYTPTSAITIENLDQFYDPNLRLAKAMPYELIDIGDFNAQAAAGSAEPF